MKAKRNFSELARSPYAWAVVAGILLSSIISVSLSQKIRTGLTEGILRHSEQRITIKTFGEAEILRPLNVKKLATLSLWGGKGGNETVTAKASQAGRPSAVPTGASLLLKGIVRYPDGHFEAVFSNQKVKRSFIVKRGDKLGDFDILNIKPDQVEVSKKGVKSSFYLFTGKRVKQGRGTKAATSRLNEGNRHHVVLNKREVQTALGDMASFLRQVRIVPYMDRGKPKGFQLLEIVPGSIVDRVGLKNRDVVERVNGKPIHTPQEAMRLFTLLQSGQGVTLEVKRGNRHESITVDLK